MIEHGRRMLHRDENRTETGEISAKYDSETYYSSPGVQWISINISVHVYSVYPTLLTPGLLCTHVMYHTPVDPPPKNSARSF